MIEQIFVNLPVADLKVSMAFFRSLGFEFNPKFTNDSGACLMLGPNIYAMLLVKPFFAGFTSKEIVDAHTHTETLTALQVESREKVDELVAAAVAAGGTAPRPVKDFGFMYQHSFDDPDGHIWEVFCMDVAAMPAA